MESANATIQIIIIIWFLEIFFIVILSNETETIQNTGIRIRIYLISSMPLTNAKSAGRIIIPEKAKTVFQSNGIPEKF